MLNQDLSRVQAGIEVGDVPFHPVCEIDRKKQGWVKVVVKQEDVCYNGTLINLALRLIRQPGRLITVTPRQNLLQEDLGVLMRLMGTQDLYNPTVEFWFQQEQKGKVIQV